MTFKACLFDMNGVLVDDEPLQEEAFRLTLASYGCDLTAEMYKECFIGRTDRNGYEAYFENKEIPADIYQLIEEKGKAYQSLAEQGVQAYPGTEDFIRILSEHNTKLALVTSSMRAEAEAVLTGLGIRDFFQAIIAADDVTQGKPDPEGYLKGAETLGMSAQDCLVIEDAPSGLTAAKAAGMACLAVTNTHNQEQLAVADIIVGALSADLATELLS